MYCPNCGDLNLPGAEACKNCQQSLTSLDSSQPLDRLEQSLANDPVSRLMLSGLLVTVPLEAKLGWVISAMIDHDVGAVLLVNADGTLAGILTERDFLTKVAGQPGLTELPAKDFMTPNPETVSPTDTVAFALGKMNLRGYRHLPVINDGKPVGMLSVRDVLKYVTGLCWES
jgi:CBS domain-containing protein